MTKKFSDKFFDQLTQRIDDLESNDQIEAEQKLLSRKFITHAFKTFLHLPISDAEKVSEDEVHFDSDEVFGIMSKRK